MSSLSNFDSEHLNKATNGILDTFLYCCYIFAVVYGFFKILTDVLILGVTTIIIVVAILSLVVNYLKVPHSPKENVTAVFGSDPILPVPIQTNSQRKKGSLSNSNPNGDNDKDRNHVLEESKNKKDIANDINIDENDSGATTQDVPNGVLTNCVTLLKNHYKNDEVKNLNAADSVPSRLLPLEGALQYTTPITIVGHRGAGLDAPENTLTAFRQCKARGCNFVEFDVSLTKDNVPVIFHDDDLIRVAGLDKKICDMTWEELKKVDLSVNHPLREKYAGEGIPCFEETLQLLIDLEIKFFIDLKDTNELIVNTICEAFTRHPQLYKLAVVSSFYARVIYDIRRRDPQIIGCMAWRPQYHQFKGWSVDGSLMEPRYTFFLQDWLASFWDICHDWLVTSFYWWFLGLSAILLHKDAVSKHELMQWSKRTVRVFLWTVNSPLEKLVLSQNIRVSYLTDTLDGDVLKAK